MTQIDTSREAVAALVRKLRSQIGDDVQEAYSHEALFMGASEALTALLDRADLIPAMLAEAEERGRKAEREACAQTCENLPGGYFTFKEAPGFAAAIRAREEEQKS